jgi:hypothetical protein
MLSFDRKTRLLVDLALSAAAKMTAGPDSSADVRALQARVLSQLLKGAALGECGTKLKTLSCLQLLPKTPTHAEESLPEVGCSRKRSGRRQTTKRKSLSGGAPENTWP